MSKPKQILKNAIKNYLLDKLNGEGFIYSDSSLKFSRTFGMFKNEIVFLGSKTNYEDILVNFQVHFNIYSSEYKRWHTEKFPDLQIIGAGLINPDRDKYIQSLDNDLQLGSWHNFTILEQKKTTESIYIKFQNFAIPYFTDNENWSKIAENTNSNGILKLDSLIISGRVDEAYEYCNKTINIFEQEFGDNISGHALQILIYFKARKELLRKN